MLFLVCVICLKSKIFSNIWRHQGNTGLWRYSMAPDQLWNSSWMFLPSGLVGKLLMVKKLWHQMSSNEPGGQCWHAESLNVPPSHLKWASSGAEGLHTISTLGDGKDTQAVVVFPRTAVVGWGEEKKNFPHTPFRSSPPLTSDIYYYKGSTHYGHFSSHFWHRNRKWYIHI